MSWKEFSEGAPELAALGQERLDRRIAYLATIRHDGSPRLHPVRPFIGAGRLFIFTEPSSPKIRDLRRDPRYALHCAVEREGPLVEFLVSGKTEVITDAAVREELASIAASPVVLESYVLFEFQVGHVLVVTYDEEKRPVVRRWRRK